MYFSGGWSSEVLGDPGWVGGTMEICSRSGSVQVDHCPYSSRDHRGCCRWRREGPTQSNKVLSAM